MHRSVQIQHDDFSLDAQYAAVRDRHGPALGAVAAFVGLVRDLNPHTGDASQVATLTLEHYPGMTEASIDKILDQAQARWPLLEARVIHRIGALTPAAQIVLVVVGAAHRDAAFAAAEFIMDYLKTDAVFWKKEHTAKGEHWVESTSVDHQRAAQWRESDLQGDPIDDR